MISVLWAVPPERVFPDMDRDAEVLQTPMELVFKAESLILGADLDDDLPLVAVEQSSTELENPNSFHYDSYVVLKILNAYPERKEVKRTAHIRRNKFTVQCLAYEHEVVGGRIIVDMSSGVCGEVDLRQWASSSYLNRVVWFQDVSQGTRITLPSFLRDRIMSQGVDNDGARFLSEPWRSLLSGSKLAPLNKTKTQQTLDLMNKCQ